MPKGIAFLNTKSWHVASFRMQKTIWEAEEKARSEKRKEEIRVHDFAKEKSYHDSMQQLKGKSHQGGVEFMYQPPPGYVQEKAPGIIDEEPKQKSRKELDEEHFPILKGAPLKASYADDVDLCIKPFGQSILKVQCIRCKEWGHRSGDRSCPMVDDNPNRAWRDTLEDPMSLLKAVKEGGRVLDGKLQFKQGRGPADVRGRSPIRGGIHATAENQQLLPPDPEEEEEDSDVDRKFIQSLSKKERKLLLKRIKKEERKRKRETEEPAGLAVGDNQDIHRREEGEAEGNKEKQKSKKSKSRKEHKRSSKRRRRSPSSSSSSSSSSDERADR